jgi:hypothetical protein
MVVSRIRSVNRVRKAVHNVVFPSIVWTGLNLKTTPQPTEKSLDKSVRALSCGTPGAPVNHGLTHAVAALVVIGVALIAPAPAKQPVERTSAVAE